MSATSKDKENCSKERHQCFPSFFHRLAFLIIVRIEAKAERPRQIHWARGGTSGTIENIKNVKLVADPNSGDCPEGFIYSNPLTCSQTDNIPSLNSTGRDSLEIAIDLCPFPN